MKQRINARLALISLIAIIATAVGVTLVYYGLFQTQVRSDLRLSANLLMETEVFQNAYASENKNTAALQRLSSGDLRITWIDEDGTVLFDNDTDVSGLSNHFDRPEIRQALEQGEGESTRKSDTLNMNTFYYALLLEDGTVLRVSTQARTITGVFLVDNASKFSYSPLSFSRTSIRFSIKLATYITSSLHIWKVIYLQSSPYSRHKYLPEYLP